MLAPSGARPGDNGPPPVFLAGLPAAFFAKKDVLHKNEPEQPGPVETIGPGKLKHHVTPTTPRIGPPHNRGPRTEPDLRAQATATPAKQGGHGRRRGGDCLAIPNRRCPRGGGKTDLK